MNFSKQSDIKGFALTQFLATCENVKPSFSFSEGTQTDLNNMEVLAVIGPAITAIHRSFCAKLEHAREEQDLRTHGLTYEAMEKMLDGAVAAHSMPQGAQRINQMSDTLLNIYANNIHNAFRCAWISQQDKATQTDYVQKSAVGFVKSLVASYPDHEKQKRNLARGYLAIEQERRGYANHMPTVYDEVKILTQKGFLDILRQYLHFEINGFRQPEGKPSVAQREDIERGVQALLKKVATDLGFDPTLATPKQLG